jgi:two-component system response regulator MprA
VDDDAPIRRMLERTLTASGFDVRVAGDGGAALVLIERETPDVLVLDVAMPGLDGLVVTRRLRAKGLAFPIILLTARDAITDRVAGLEAGADDYLVKPFAVEELVARLDALQRRGRIAPETLAVRDVRLEVSSGRAERAGRPLHLTPREAELLAVLLERPGQLVTREQILDRVWRGSASTSNVVDRYIAYLRVKLGEPPLITTVRGSGFVLGPR